MQIIIGKTYVIGDDIDTDQIIPAEYLVYSMSEEEEAKKYGRYALSGIEKDKAGLPFGNIPFVNEGDFKSEFSIIIAGKNFGCGSSREHAPFALAKAGVKAIVANSYARIFYRNCVDGGFVIPFEVKENLSEIIETGEIIKIDPVNYKVFRIKTNQEFQIKELGAVAEIISEGGIFNYARKLKLI